jgi:hypothetical protein
MAMHAALLTSSDSLANVIGELGFIQYDPIRRPARAQDLILHQRVGGYRRGDLERRYGKLGLEEGFFYIYGAMTPELYRLLHPRRDRRRPDEAYQPSGLAAEVLAVVREQGPTHPRSLEKQFGRTRAVNGWGGFSAATTRALEQLHYHGLLRIAYREAGVKVFAATESLLHDLSEAERHRTLTLRLARVLAPVREGSLRGALNQLGRYGGVKIEHDSAVAQLLASNRLSETTIGGARYLWPTEISSSHPKDVTQRVRFLAPFDPAVWDRARFEQLWGWAYRFEAYTPAEKRQFGYYALPMFWGDRAIGWVNCEIEDGKLTVERQFAMRPLRGKRFEASFDREVSRLERMLGLSEPAT